MLTIFAIPKPLIGHDGIIQRNAIESWRRLQPACEVILCGNDEGVPEIASEFGLQHLADVDCTGYGTPLLDSVFRQVAQIAQYKILCYVNADIMFTDDLLETIARIRLPHFLMSGQRWDVDITQPWDFESPDWKKALQQFVTETGHLHSPNGMDYFVFVPNGALEQLHPFAVGRAGWDNWFIGHARQLGIPIIDASRAIRAIHQNHGYGHVPKRQGDKYLGPESKQNLDMIGHYKHNLLDATHSLTQRFILPAIEPRYLNRRLLRFRSQLYMNRHGGGDAAQ